jgi:NADPH2:quinone reductase
LKRGQRVFGAQLGSFADKVAVGLEQLLPLPDNLSYDQGAGSFFLLTLFDIELTSLQ